MKITQCIHVIVLMYSLFISSGFSYSNEIKKTLNIAYITPIPPYIYQSNNVATGRLIHSLRSILGNTFSIRVSEEEKKSLVNSNIQAVIGTAPALSSLPYVKAFTITTIPLALYYRGQTLAGIEEASAFTSIGYVDVGIPLHVLQEYYPSLQLRSYPSMEQAIENLEKGKIQAAILPEASFALLTKTQYKQLASPVAYMGINFYVKKDDTVLLNTITSTFVQRLISEPAIQSSPTSYIILFFVFLLFPLLLFVLYRKAKIPEHDALYDTTIEIAKEVFLDYFICTVTEKGTILSISQGVTKILGYTPESLIGSSIKKIQKDASALSLSSKNEIQHCPCVHINGSSLSLAFFPIKTISTSCAEEQYEFIVFNIGQLVERQEHAFSVVSLYQAIFAKSPIGIARYSVKEGIFIHKNPVFENMMQSGEKLSFAHLFGEYAEDIIEKTRQGLIHETISIEEHGQEKWFIVYANGVDIAYKYYIDMFLIDVTAWYKAQQQAEEAYNYLRKIIDILPDPTFILDNDKRIIAWNKALEELTGVSAKAMLGKDDSSYSIPFYGTHHNMLCDEFYISPPLHAEGEKYPDTLTKEEFCPALGSGKYLWISASVLRKSNGSPTAVIQTMQDITESKEDIMALERSKERYIMVLEASNEGIWEVDSENYRIQASPKCYDILGLPENSILNYKDLLQYIYPEYREDIVSRMQLLLEGKIERTEFVFRMLTPDNVVKWIQSAVFANKNNAGAMIGIVGSCADITERKEHENITRIIFLISNAVNIAREPKELFQAIHTILTRYVGYTNLIVALWNEKEECMEYPYYYDEYYNKEKYTSNVHSRENAPYPISDIFTSGVQLVSTEKVQHNEEEVTLVWLATPLRVLDSIIGVIATHKLQNIHTTIDTVYSKNDKELMVAIGEQIGIAIERYNSKEQLTAMALHDPLTNLPNRVLFSDRLDHAIRRVNRSAEYRFAVFMLDLDRFKLINDTYGHNTGDLLLIEVANRIQPLLRSEDTFARLGGDEFAIILENIGSTHEVLAVAKRILRAIEQPLIVDGKELKTATSIGIVLDASNYDSAHTLLRDADIAMYDAKTNGKGRFRVFDQAMHQQMLEYVSLENDLNNAIENHELFLEYQPIVDAQSTALVGFEALVRWNHPEQGVIYPDRFINIAEENGFIIKLGTWVLEEASRVMKSWNEALPSSSILSMSVNISAKQAVQGNLPTTIMDIIHSAGIAPSQINLEVTETTIMKDPKNAKISFEELRSNGVCIAIDDFGSGYSSMTYLQRFPVDILKIDRAFIQNASTEDGGIEIVRAICALAHGLRMKVIAEGVETEGQLNIVKECNCDYIQGYLFSRPLNEEKAFLYLEKKVKEGKIGKKIG